MPENTIGRYQKLARELEDAGNLQQYMPITLHLKLDITETNEEYLSSLDQILFGLIFNKCLEMGNGYLFLDNVNSIDIEIANTLNKSITDTLSSLSALKLSTHYTRDHVCIEKIKQEDINLEIVS